jgi:hypothetical protein
MTTEIGSRPLAPFSFAPQGNGFGTRLAHTAAIAAAFFTFRQFLEALKGAPGGAAMGGEPPGPSEDEDPASHNIWNDPAFWMMFMH